MTASGRSSRNVSRALALAVVSLFAAGGVDGAAVAAAASLSGSAAGEGGGSRALGRDPARSNQALGRDPARPNKTAELPERYRQWLLDVALLITKDERKSFLALTQDYQRDGFIHRFWEARNPDPRSPRNRVKAEWEARLDRARTDYGNITEDRARMLLLHGPPASVMKTDCQSLLWPVEVWYYPVGFGERLPGDFYLLFWQPAAGGTFRLWHSIEGPGELLSRFGGDRTNGPDRGTAVFIAELIKKCPVENDILIAVFLRVTSEDYSAFFNLLDSPPPPRDKEWLTTFQAVSTELPPGVADLPAQLDVRFPRRERQRTVVAALLRVSATAAQAAESAAGPAPAPVRMASARRADAGAPASGRPPAAGRGGSYDFLVEAEVLHESELVESFRYTFNIPVSSVSGAEIPLAFERLLWPGTYILVVRLEDLHSHAGHREELPLAVPSLESPAAAAGTEEGGPRPLVLRIARPVDPRTRAVRVAAELTDGGEALRRVTFFLDGKAMLTKARPPYEVELNLGTPPRRREVKAVVYDAAGQEVASDTLVLEPDASAP